MIFDQTDSRLTICKFSLKNCATLLSRLLIHSPLLSTRSLSSASPVQLSFQHLVLSVCSGFYETFVIIVIIGV